MRGRSVALRLDRLADRGTAGDRERLVRDVAAESGLGEAEVRAELAAIEEDDRRYGPQTIEQVVARCAQELGLPEAEVWAEYEQTVAADGAPR